MIETVNHNGKLYYRINPKNIDLDAMQEVRKVADVYAYQVKEGGRIRIKPRNEDHYRLAQPGDWIVYNIGNGVGETLQERMETCDVKILPEETFERLYARKESDDSDYSDFSTIDGGHLFTYTGRSVYAARVPFNFVIHSPWGEDQYVEAGGYLIYNKSTSTPEVMDVYGIAGSHHRKPGQLEKTYTIIGDGNEKPIYEVYKHCIMSDRTPLPGVQFTPTQMKEAYARIGRDRWGQHSTHERGKDHF